MIVQRAANSYAAHVVRGVLRRERVHQYSSNCTMPLIKIEGIPDPEGGVRACLRSYGCVERYITAVQDYLPVVQDPEAAVSIQEQAHQAVLLQLQPRLPKFFNGAELMAAMESTRLMPIGVDSVDELLLGGLKETAVTEISGETCSGKTQLCQMASVTTAKRGEEVVYFDTTNAFNAVRVQQLVEKSKFDDSVPDAVALSRVSCVPCHSIYALLTSLDELARQGSRLESSAQPKLIIVDSISALLAPVIGATQHHQGNVLVSETGRLLRQVAETLHAAVLVTNHVVGAGGFGRQPSAAPTGGAGLYDVNTDYKPALGEQWRGMPHVRLQLSRATAVADVTCMTVLAHPLREPGHQAWIRVSETITDAHPSG